MSAGKEIYHARDDGEGARQPDGTLRGRGGESAGGHYLDISKKGEGTVVVSMVGIDGEHRICHQYYQEPLDEVVSQLVEKL